MALLPYHATRKYSMRPNAFRLAPDHVLNDGCVFMGGGNLAGGKKYFDSSTSKKDGTLFNIDISGWHKDLGRACLEMDDNIVQYVDINRNLYSMGLINHGSISMWWKPNHFSDTQYMFGDWNDSQGVGAYATSANAYTGYVYPLNSRINTASASWTTNWQHIVFDWSTDTSLLQLFVNGKRKFWNTLLGPCGSSATSFKIGQRGDAATASNGLDGSTSDLIIHDRILEDQEIKTLASIDPMLDGWVQPINTETYFLPIGDAPPTPARKSNIFKSRIIRGVAC